jgi:DNA-binding response OmpR family regulator
MQRDCTCPLCGSEVGELPVTLLPERGMVVASGRFAVLTGHEMQLLQRLVEIFPRVLTKEGAIEWMYQINPDRVPEIKIIDVFVCKLRKKIDPLGVRIDTLWGKGYALAVAVKPTIVREAA